MELGKRIKLLRKKQQRTQDEIASACGFTVSLLSKIENGKTTPPVATLMKIAKTLGVKVSDLLDENTDQTTVLVQEEDVKDPNNWVSTNKGYSFFAVASSRGDKIMQPFFFSAKKGETRSNVFSHLGEEFIYMLEGNMKYRVGSMEYTLKPGDSIYFSSLEEHSLTPISDTVKYLAVFSEAGKLLED